MEEENRGIWKKFLITGLTSAALFMLTYYAVILLTGLSELYIAYDFDIPAILHQHGTEFLISESHPRWTRDATISILLATPVSSFILSLSAVFLFLVRKQKNELMLHTTIWLILQAFNMTFGLINENLITQTGVTRIARLQNIDQSFLIFFACLAFYIMFQFGMFTARLHFAYANETFRKYRHTSVLVFFFLPWLLGNILILAISGFDLRLKDLLIKLMMLVMLIPAFFVKLPPKEPIQPSPAYIVVLVSLTSGLWVWIAVQLLNKGISF